MIITAALFSVPCVLIGAWIGSRIEPAGGEDFGTLAGFAAAAVLSLIV